MVTRRVVSLLQTTTPHGAAHRAASEEVPSAPRWATGMGCGGFLVRADLRVWQNGQRHTVFQSQGAALRESTRLDRGGL